MLTKFVEVTNEVGGRPFNWGKFMVARFTEGEWARQSNEPVAGMIRLPLLDMIGWGARHVIIFDLQTCEGAAFLPGGYPKADLEKHKIWVCPLFEPFLEWLYTQDLTNLDALPNYVFLKDAPADMKGYRREGHEKENA
jgi:hypothetical protein